jgi:hypothetical protein
VIGRGAVVLSRVGLFALLVDRGREVVDQRLPVLVIHRREREHLDVGLLGLRVLGELQRGMRHDREGLAAQLGFGTRIALDQLLRRGYARPEVLHGVQIVRGRAEHGWRLLVRGEGIGEPE